MGTLPSGNIPVELRIGRQMRCPLEEKDGPLSVCLLPSGPSVLSSHFRSLVLFPVKCHNVCVEAVWREDPYRDRNMMM